MKDYSNDRLSLMPDETAEGEWRLYLDNPFEYTFGDPEWEPSSLSHWFGFLELPSPARRL